MRKLSWILAVAALLTGMPDLVRGDAEQAPWWRQQKIRLMWGHWNHERVDLEVDHWGMNRNLGRNKDIEFPRRLFQDIAVAGATVFVELEGYRPIHASHAHDFGMKYFATRYVATLSSVEGRKWVNESGRHHWLCPLDQSAYERWMFEMRNDESILEGVKQGLVDGIMFDWEAYGGNGEAGLCYCDVCMAGFPGFAESGQKLPPAELRDEWIEKQGLTDAFKVHRHEQRIAMWTSIRQKLHAIKPDLLFGSYDKMVEDFTQGMHTREAPFIIADAQHYFNDQRQPWWWSYGSVFKDRGYLYIPGAWANSLFGAQASEVSAARWIYETAINEDGAWLWFERELDDEMLRAYATADRRIQTVVSKAGRYLFQGKRDYTFATAVEWTGRPDLERAVKCLTYHLDDEHLVHVNNVHTEWPLRVTLRFPRVRGKGPWTVSDAIGGLPYAHDFDKLRWSSDELAAGVSVALDPRTDVFLLLSPVDESTELDPSTAIHSRTFDMLPDRSTPSSGPGPIREMIQLYVMGNAIHGEDLNTLRDGPLETFMTLPKEGWSFRMDKQDIGAQQGWFKPGVGGGDWTPIQIESFWGSQGGTGPGWYKAELEIPALPDDKQVYLHFDGVDEELVLWINGQYAGDYNRGLHGWDKPFAIDVTGRLVTGRNHLAMRVYNSAAAGGVWKPVSVLVGPKKADATAGAREDDTAGADSPAQLVYTATESMGMRGSTAGLSIANTIRTMQVGTENQRRVRQLRAHLWRPTWSPDGDRILFSQDLSGKGQIHVMHAAGTGVKNLSDNAHCDRGPSWSPDGERIAFVSDRTADWDIYVMDADGSNQRRIAGRSGHDFAPAWSPDGTMLAWESHTSGRPEVWVCDASGGNEHPVLRPQVDTTYTLWENGKSADVEPIMRSHEVFLTRPVWSPDSTRLAGTGMWKYRMCYVLRLDGSRLDVLAPGGVSGADNLCWSPDGTRLAGSFATAPQETERAGIFLLNATNGTTRFIVDVEPTGPRAGRAHRWVKKTWYTHGSAQPRRVVKSFASLAWSTDNRTLAFSSDMDTDGAFHIYTIDVDTDGAKPVRLDQTLSVWPQQVMWRPQ